MEMFQNEWYEDVSADELAAIRSAMVGGSFGMATHSGHWYNCVNGHPVSDTFRIENLRILRMLTWIECSSPLASAGCRWRELDSRNVVLRLVGRIMRLLMVLRGLWIWRAEKDYIYTS